MTASFSYQTIGFIKYLRFRSICIISEGSLVKIIYPPEDSGKEAVVIGPAPKKSSYQSWSEVIIREIDSGRQYTKETDCIEFLCEVSGNIVKLLYV